MYLVTTLDILQEQASGGDCRIRNLGEYSRNLAGNSIDLAQTTS
jgi:hypothetical protein